MSTTDVVFAGSIPAIYDRCLGPLLFQPYAEDIADRLGDISQGTILETAAGTGVVTRALSKALPSNVAIVATDLNQAMLDHAATQLKATNVSWKQADAQALPFDDGIFDAVVCQLGAMFFPDKPKAYREARRVLRPNGRFVFNVWDRLEANEVSHIISATVAAVFPEDPPRFLERTPFGYADPDLIRQELQQAEFERIDIAAVEKVSLALSSREPATGMCQGSPLRNEIEARAPDRLQEVTDKVADALAARFGNASFENRMRAYVVTALSA